jgi:BLOC-1 related complex subunit 8
MILYSLYFTAVTKKFTEYLHVLSNEPSVGLFHIQEHIKKTIPRSVEIKREMKKKYQAVESTTYDVDFSIQTVKSLHDLVTFQSIKQLMDNCVEMLNINRYISIL